MDDEADPMKLSDLSKIKSWSVVSTAIEYTWGVFKTYTINSTCTISLNFFFQCLHNTFLHIMNNTILFNSHTIKENNAPLFIHLIENGFLSLSYVFPNLLVLK